MTKIRNVSLTALLRVLARQGIFFAFLEDTGFKKGDHIALKGRI